MKEQETNMIDLKAIGKALLKKWYWFAISLVLFGTLGVLYFLSAPMKFQVDAQVQLRSEDGFSLPGSDMLQLIGLGGSKKTDDEIAIMTSRDNLEQVVRELDIQSSYSRKQGLRWVGQYGAYTNMEVVYPEMFLDTMKTIVTIDIKVRKNDYKIKVKNHRFSTQTFVVQNFDEPLLVKDLGPVFIKLHKPLEEDAHYRIRTAPFRAIVKYYSTEIIVAKIKKESSIIRLSTITAQPSLAVDFIRKQIDVYNSNSVIDKKLMANSTALFIEERLNLIAQELASAEADVERYKKANSLTQPEVDLEIYIKENAEYRHRLEELETQMRLVSYIESFVKDEKNDGQLIPANLGITDESLSALVNQYDGLLLRRMRMDRTATDSNPVVMQINDQIAIMKVSILSSIRSVKNSLAISKDDLESLARKSNNMLSTVPTKEREYIEKARNKELQQKLYLYLYQKREENALSLVTAVPPAQVVIRPQVDIIRMKPRLRNIAVVCLFFGLAFPVALLYLMFLLNTKITGRRQYEQLMQVPYVGELLNVPEGDFIAVGDGIDSTAAELYRLLRTNIYQALKKDEKVLLVTSCINNEGKSYVASNLAMSFALLEKRVALVELDLRNPSLAEHFAVSSAKGVAPFLSGKEYGIEEMLLSSGRNKNLDILPAGALPINPNELLQSERLDQLIAILRKQYDYIILDSAPVAMVSDTFVANRVCDMTLLVARVGETTIDMAEYANTLAEQKRLNNMVCILNAVEREDLPYGHSYGYVHRKS